MVDARIQIMELLREIEVVGLSVKMNFPKSINDAPLLTFFEINNTRPNKAIKVKETISYQIDCWTEDFESCIDLMQAVDEKMTVLGLNRDYVSPDSDCYDASGFYRKTLRYSCNVDTRTNRIIS